MVIQARTGIGIYDFNSLNKPPKTTLLLYLVSAFWRDFLKVKRYPFLISRFANLTGRNRRAVGALAVLIFFESDSK